MITIAIPFFNGEKYLELAIQSVLAQTYKDWKLILIDDGSTDSSLEIANKYAKTDARITVYSDGENKNLGYRLNQIPSLVNTKYLARMDADDIMHPKRIEKQLEILEANPEIDVLGTNAYSINEHNEVEGIRLAVDLENPEVIDCKSFIHPTIMAKTEWFRNNPYDVQAVRIEDFELWYRTREFSTFKVLTEPLFFYREFGDNYYKKYSHALKSKDYILSKHSKNVDFWKKYFNDKFIKSKVYRLFDIFGLEKVLINKRNVIRFNKKNNYINFCN